MTTHPPDLTVRLTINTSALTAALDRMREGLLAMRPAFARAAQSLARIATITVERMNDPVRVAGLCARYQVRAGMDPLYASHGNVDRLVQAILTGDATEAEGLVLLSQANRVLVAVAAMRGWSESYGWAVPQGVLHRQWGTTRVEVRCG